LETLRGANQENNKAQAFISRIEPETAMPEDDPSDLYNYTSNI
jgi:hypothetical protein